MRAKRLFWCASRAWFCGGEEWPQTLDHQWLANLYHRYGEKPYGETK